MSTIDFTSFLKLMAHQKASDLFITSGMPPSIKVHGKISPITQTPLTAQQSRDLVLNVMTPQQRQPATARRRPPPRPPAWAPGGSGRSIR